MSDDQPATPPPERPAPPDGDDWDEDFAGDDLALDELAELIPDDETPAQDAAPAATPSRANRPADLPAPARARPAMPRSIEEQRPLDLLADDGDVLIVDDAPLADDDAPDFADLADLAEPDAAGGRHSEEGSRGALHAPRRARAPSLAPLPPSALSPQSPALPDDCESLLGARRADYRHMADRVFRGSRRLAALSTPAPRPRYTGITQSLQLVTGVGHPPDSARVDPEQALERRLQDAERRRRTDAAFAPGHTGALSDLLTAAPPSPARAAPPVGRPALRAATFEIGSDDLVALDTGGLRAGAGGQGCQSPAARPLSPGLAAGTDPMLAPIAAAAGADAAARPSSGPALVPLPIGPDEVAAGATFGNGAPVGGAPDVPTPLLVLGSPVAPCLPAGRDAAATDHRGGNGGRPAWEPASGPAVLDALPVSDEAFHEGVNATPAQQVFQWIQVRRDPAPAAAVPVDEVILRLLVGGGGEV